MKSTGHHSDAHTSDRDFDHVISDAVRITKKFVAEIEQEALTETERKQLLKAIAETIIERI